MNIATYCRLSTEDNQNQLDQLRAFAATQGWQIKRQYVDVATGKNGDRGAIQEATVYRTARASTDSR